MPPCESRVNGRCTLRRCCFEFGNLRHAVPCQGFIGELASFSSPSRSRRCPKVLSITSAHAHGHFFFVTVRMTKNKRAYLMMKRINRKIDSISTIYHSELVVSRVSSSSKTRTNQSFYGLAGFNVEQRWRRYYTSTFSSLRSRFISRFRGLLLRRTIVLIGT